jgi:hypothetical protein
MGVEVEIDALEILFMKNLRFNYFFVNERERDIMCSQKHTSNYAM